MTERRGRLLAALGLLALLSRAALAQDDEARRLAALLESKDRRERLAGIAEIASRRSAGDLPLLEIAAKDEDVEVRARAVFFAVTICREKAARIIDAALADKDDDVRLTLANALSRTEGLERPLLVHACQGFLHDARRELRELAVDVFARMPDEVGFGACVDAIFDPEPSVARRAKDALLNVPERAARFVPVAKLERALDRPQLTENERFHLIQILDGLAESGARLEIAPLASTALSATHPTMRAKTLELLKSCTRHADALTAADVAAVVSLTSHADPDVRFVGYRVAIAAGGRESAAILLRGAADPDEGTRSLVRAGLLAVSDPELLAGLLEQEATGSKENRALAEKVLDADRSARSGTLVPVLLRALERPDARLRASAWGHLTAIAGPDEDLGALPGKDSPELDEAKRRANEWWKRRKK